MTMTWSIPTHLEPGPVPARLGALLCLSSTGHEHAFSMVYDAISSRIYGLVLRIVVDPDEAEEVARETFVEIWRRSADFDPHETDAAAWMSGVAHRRAVERVRSRTGAADATDAADRATG
jgi:RNA polymerase sigma-70 factor (ECF subfamily)